MRYKCQDIEAMYGLAPSTLRYWRDRLWGLSGHRQEGLFYAEVVAIGFLQHLIRCHRFRIRDLAQIYPQLVNFALYENLEELRASWLMVSAAGDRAMLLPRTENTDSYHLQWQKVDAAAFLDELDAHMKSSDELLKQMGVDNGALLMPEMAVEDGYVNNN